MTLYSKTGQRHLLHWWRSFSTANVRHK